MKGDIDQSSSTSDSGAPEHQRRKSPAVSRRLALAALALWLLSLCLPGLVYSRPVSEPESLWGYQILLLGWLGPLGYVFAWYANLFFLYVCWRLLETEGWPAFAWALSILIASDMFLHSKVPNGGGSVGYFFVYGYGWGAFFWYSALLLAGVAVGVKWLEQRHQYRGLRSIRHDGVALVATVLLVAWVGGSLSVGAVQKVMAGQTERGRLYKVVFKRGPVCTKPDYKPLAKIPLAGALQVLPDYSPRFRYTALASPVSLIHWGIPVVRKGLFDYYRSDASPDWHLVAAPATAPVAAQLTVGRDTVRVVRARLTSGDGKSTAFDAEWVRRANDNDPYYCPGYMTSAKEDEPPRSLLLSSLTRPQGAFIPSPPQKLVFQGNSSLRMDVTRVALKGTLPRSAFSGNTGCPADIGLRHLRYTKANPSEREFVPPPSWGLANRLPVDVLLHELGGYAESVFQVRDHFHFIKSLRLIEASCDGQEVYVGWGYVGRAGALPQPDDYLYLQKRTLPDFRKGWPIDRAITIHRTGDAARAAYNSLHIRSVRETEGGLRIVLAYFTKDRPEGDLIEVDAQTR